MVFGNECFTDESKLAITKGNRIKIVAMGIMVSGIVAYAEYSGLADGGWDIEVTEANVPGRYSHWKQGQDGGHIVEVNGRKI